MSSIEGVDVKSALWASITTSITRGISTNYKQATEEGGRNVTKLSGIIHQVSVYIVLHVCRSCKQLGRPVVDSGQLAQKQISYYNHGYEYALA